MSCDVYMDGGSLGNDVRARAETALLLCLLLQLSRVSESRGWYLPHAFLDLSV